MAESELSPLAPERFGTAFRSFMDAVVRQAGARSHPLVDRLSTHLGVEPTRLMVTTEEFDAFEHPNVQVAIDDFLSGAGRQAELLGISAPQKRYLELGLSDLMSPALLTQMGIVEGPVDYVNYHLAGERVLACVQLGFYLVIDGDTRLIVGVVGIGDAHRPRPKVKVEVVAVHPEESQAFLAALRAGMQRLNVYRGQVISLSPGQLGMGPQTLVAFHTLPAVTRDAVVLPEVILERIERHTVVFAAHADDLLAAGRSLKRGLLLYGPPGTGKTLTLMYLIGQMPGRTILLTTGFGMGLIAPVVQMARTLAPAMVVLEDVDLIGHDRGMWDGEANPLLFELLNEMDGLRDDADVIFALTTNRPESLELALAARPGRIDLAVHLPLPDTAGRRRLLELYSRGIELRGVDLGTVAARTGAASPAYIKELLRKAALLAVIDGDGTGVTAAHIEAALAELSEGGRLAQMLLGYQVKAQPSEDISSAASSPGAFPPGLPVVEPQMVTVQSEP